MPNRVRNMIKLNKLLFTSAFEQCTDGTFILQDDECSVKLNGLFRNLIIKFKGNVGIINNLPDGYSISFIKNKIHIRNILGRNIKNDNVLFRIINNFKIISAVAYNWEGNRIVLDVVDNNKIDSINENTTNFEDSTLILGQEGISLVPDIIVNRNTIDDNSIKGLYANTPLANGYTGYYHYYPDEKVYMTGKRPSNVSVPISTGTAKNKKGIRKVMNKIASNLKTLGLDKVSMDKSLDIKPIKTDKKELKEVSKYEEVLPQKGKQEKIIKTPSSVKKGKY